MVDVPRAGVVNLLRQNADVIGARAGRPIEVVAVSARDRTRDRGVDVTGLAWHEDAVALAPDDAAIMAVSRDLESQIRDALLLD
mgnify:CR=1 FL=1